MNPALHELLERHYRRKRTGLLILGGVSAVLLVMALGYCVYALVDGPSASRCPPRGRGHAGCVSRYENDSLGVTVALGLGPLILVIVGAIGAFPLRDLQRAPLLRTFRDRRDEVAWIYPKRTSVRRYGVEVNQIHEVVVCLTDTTRQGLTMTEPDVKAAVRLMAGEAPRAETGYSAELEAQYKRDPTSLQHAARAPATQVSGQAPASAAPALRLVVAPDFPFERLDTAIRYLGLTAEASPRAPAPIPGEPASAAWTRHGGRVTYAFDPRVYLRVLELTGNDPPRLQSEIAGVVAVPTLGPQQVLGMLAAPDPRTLLLGVLAAEALGAGADRRVYQDAVARLRTHPDATLAHEAERVYGAWS
jgi:hypothetical protein